MSGTIHIDFRRPIPLFPLPDTVLLPHAILPLQIFEPRYRQMVSHCLDHAGQIALATFDCRRPGSVDGPVPIRSAVCVGQIIRHQSLPDGRYNIWLHGVCRAHLDRVIEADDDCLYRKGRLTPLEPLGDPPEPMPELREELRDLLTVPRLKHLRGIDILLQWIDRDDVPTHALLELVGFALIRDTDRKYLLLAEADPTHRAGMLKRELRGLDAIMRQVEPQSFREWPKGLSWN
jgi:Lon protease-like protein